ncbi:MAG: WG repeat-containing protein [Clostridia bacterium]|nr:WG repeat-containing protein [Clostridia bacterium]
MSKKIIFILLIIIILIAGIGYFIFNKIESDKRDYQIEQVSEYKYFVAKENEKYGVIDSAGKTIINTEYDKIEIPNPSKDIFICYNNEKSIAMNSNKQQLFAEYNSVRAIELKNVASNIPYEKSILQSEKNGKYGIIDMTGKKLLETEYDSIQGFPNIEGQLQIEKNGKVGAANIKGTILVKPEYNTIIGDSYYSEENGYKKSGYIVGEKNENGYKYGYVDYKGKLKIKLEYNDISRVTELSNNGDVYLIAAKNGQYGIIKNQKDILNNEYQDIDYDQTTNIFILQKNKNFGVADLSGKIIIPIENTNVQAKGENIYVEKNNLKSVYNSKGEKVNIDFDKTVMPTANENYKITIMSKENGNYYGVIGANEKQVIKSEYLYIEYAFGDYFIVCDLNGKLGIIDSNEKNVIELKYDLVQKVKGKDIIQTFSSETNVTELYSKDMKKICEMANAVIENQDEYIKVSSDSEIKYFNKDGETIKSSQLFPNNKLFAATQDGKWGFVDSNGNIKVNYEYELVNEFNNYGYASVKRDGKWGAIDSEGKIIIEPKYEASENQSKVDFIDEYIKIDNGYGNSYYSKE